jgi:hypothetical protein
MNRYRQVGIVAGFSALAAAVFLFCSVSGVPAATGNSHDYAWGMSLGTPNVNTSWMLAKGPGGRTTGGPKTIEPINAGKGQINPAEPVGAPRFNPAEPVGAPRFNPAEPVNGIWFDAATPIND